MSTNDEFNQAMAAAKAGNRPVARQLFQTLLAREPQNELGWLWLSGLLDEPAQRRDCLQRVLAINPANELARKGLDQLAQSEAASFLAAFEPNRKVVTIEPPPLDLKEPIRLPFTPEKILGMAQQVAAATTPLAAPVGPPPEMPPISKVTEAPCVFCGAPTGVEGVCGACGIEQVLDCPQCARLVDLRETKHCSCGAIMEPFIVGTTLNRETLGAEYLKNDYPAAAVRQWKAALDTSTNPSYLHMRIAEVYFKLGMIDQARMHNDLSKQRRG